MYSPTENALALATLEIPRTPRRLFERAILTWHSFHFPPSLLEYKARAVYFQIQAQVAKGMKCYTVVVISSANTYLSSLQSL